MSRGCGVSVAYNFDHDLLKDPIIAMDLQLNALLRKYRAIVGITSHSTVSNYDTVWLKLNGYGVSKADSDSLWSDIPHK